jgi:hypothetical protein
MKAVRWAAAAATLLMGLMNLPVVIDDGGNDLPTALGAVVSVVGVLGIAAAVALVRRVPWARAAVVALGAVNLAGAVWALATGLEGAAIGLVVSALGLGLGLLTPDAGTRAATSTPSLT